MSDPGKPIDWDEVRARLRRSQDALEKALSPDAARTEAVLRVRAVQLAGRRAAAATGPAALRVLTFFVGAERYGLEFADVAELLPLGRCTPVPGAAAALLGVMGVRGEIRSVVDLGRLLELPATDGPAGGYVVLVRKGAGRAALRVDRLDRVQAVAVAQLAVPDGAAAGATLRYLRGIAADHLRLLDTDALLAHPLFPGAAP